MRPRIAFVFWMALMAGACSTGSGGSSEPSRNRNVLTAEELAPMDTFSAWDAVRRFRPMWMRPGGVRNSANPGGHYPFVFVDGAPYGPMESLRSFRVLHVQEMRFINATDATIRYGGEYQGGVILITTQG